MRAGVDERRVRVGAASGSWLGGGVRVLGTAFKWLVPAGAIAGSVLYLAFVFHQFAVARGVEGGSALWLDGFLEAFQGETLVAAGKWLAGGALTITALGSRFTETFGRLRVAIDAVLDIDNYFGDPPNRQPPRARIFSRYASLLAYLRDAGYARIVIVAHSQGTVISADLLRYLHVQGRLQDVVGGAPVALVTVGSPLRDLYAERFPLLYRWMGSRDAGFAARRAGGRRPRRGGVGQRLPVGRLRGPLHLDAGPATRRSALRWSAPMAGSRHAAPATAPNSASAPAVTRTTSATTPWRWRSRSSAWSRASAPSGRRVPGDPPANPPRRDCA